MKYNLMMHRSIPLRKAIEDYKPVSIQIGKYKYGVEKRYSYWGEQLYIIYIVSRWIPQDFDWYNHLDMSKDDIPATEQVIWGDNIPKNSWGKALLELLKVN